MISFHLGHCMGFNTLISDSLPSFYLFLFLPFISPCSTHLSEATYEQCLSQHFQSPSLLFHIVINTTFIHTRDNKRGFFLKSALCRAESTVGCHLPVFATHSCSGVEQIIGVVFSFDGAELVVVVAVKNVLPVGLVEIGLEGWVRESSIDREYVG